jgi:hypothetical protein
MYVEYLLIYPLIFIYFYFFIYLCDLKPHSELFYIKQSHHSRLYSIYTPPHLIGYDIPNISRRFQSFSYIIFSGKENSYHESENL